MTRPIPRTPTLMAFAALCCVATTAVTHAEPTTHTANKANKAEKPPKADGAKTPWDVEQPKVSSKTVPIDVRTGTWMNLDVSPDGSFLVFDLLGNIYRLPTQGGEARALTQGLAWDMQPTISPDGRSVAFTSDRAGGDNIWVMSAEGEKPRQITKETYRLMTAPAWSPDGQFIVARKHFTSRRSIGAGEMWLMHADGSKGVQLTKKHTDQKDEGEPAFSPDGRTLYLSRDVSAGPRFEYNKNAAEGIYAIEKLDLRTGERSRVTGGPGGAIRPTPSPDGKKLAFVRRFRGRSALYIRDLASGTETRLFEGMERDLQESWAIHGVYPQMAFGPKSRQLYFWAKGKIWRIHVVTRKITPIPFHVQDTRRLLTPLRHAVEVAPPRFDVKMVRWPSPGPGEQVVFQALGRLYLQPKGGKASRPLTGEAHAFEFYPSVTRDGKSAVYVHWTDEGLGSVRRVSLKGRNVRTLTLEPGHYVEPVLSPNGETLVYRRVAAGWLTSPRWSVKRGIFSLNLNTGKERRISKGGEGPHFGLDSSRVFFLERGDKDVRVLKSARLDGSRTRAHVESKAATAFRVSPDGQHLAWTEGFSLYLTTFPDTARLRHLGPKDTGLPVRKVSVDSAFSPVFSNDSQRLYWQLGPTLSSVRVAEAMAAAGARKSDVTRQLGFTAAADVPAGKVAIVGAKVITMRGDEVLASGTILIEGNRIVQVGPAADVRVPLDAFVIDGRGMSAFPGIVDVHAHGAQAAHGINPQRSWLNAATLAFGVTTIHDPSNRSSSIFSSAELVKAGRTLGPRIFSTGTILYGAKGSFRAEINTLKDAEHHLHRMKALGAFSVKSYNQPRRNQRQQVLAAARKLTMMVVPEGGALFQHNMSMVADGHTGIEHSIPLAHAYDDVLQFWSGTRVGYTPTFNVAYGGLMGENFWYQERPIYRHPRLRRFVPERVLNARARRPVTAPDHEWNHIDVARFAHRFEEAGGMVQVGGHGQREGLGAHWEIWSFVQGGMSPHRALRAATLGGAKYLGLDRDLGSIDGGKLADIVLVKGDVLSDIRLSEHVSVVVANGRVFDATTLAQQAPTPGPAPTFFFQTDGVGADPKTRADGVCHGCQ